LLHPSLSQTEREGRKSKHYLSAYGWATLSQLTNWAPHLSLLSRTGHLQYFATRLSGAAQHVFVLKGGMGKKQRRLIAETMADLPHRTATDTTVNDGAQRGLDPLVPPTNGAGVCVEII